MSDRDLVRLSAEKHLFLTTRGRVSGKSHMVEVWFAVAGGRVYLSHEGDFTDWMKNILRDDGVELKIGGVTFSGRAKVVEKDGAVFDAGKHALYRKYYGEASEEVVDDWFSESNVIEISLG